MVGVIIVFISFAFAFASQGYGVGGGLFIGAIIYWGIAVLVQLIVPIVILATKGTLGANRYGPEATIELFTGFKKKQNTDITDLPQA